MTTIAIVEDNAGLGASLRRIVESTPECECVGIGKTIPAYGIYARHVRGITLKNVRTTSQTPDARPATVFIDVEGITPANFAIPK